MKSLSPLLVLFGCFATSSLWSATPDTLTLADLSRHPERWPESIVATRDYAFSSGAKVRKGQTLRVIELNGGQVGVEAVGGVSFEISVQESGVLAAANAAWAKLTPAQRQVDVAYLAATSSLWPERVRCINKLQFGGQVVPAGSEHALLACSRDEVKIYVESAHTTLTVDLRDTDIIARARERALLAPEKRSSRLVAALQGKLIDAKGQPFDGKAFDDAQVFVLYYGASWCGPCHKFSPSLVEFVNKTATQNPRMAVVMMSNDKSDAELQGYMQEQKMPWPAMPLSTLLKTPLLTFYAKTGIPQLLVLDRYGRVLSDSYDGERYLGPQVPLQELARLVKTGLAR